MTTNRRSEAQVFVGALMTAGETVPNELLYQAGIMDQPKPLTAVREILVTEITRLQTLVKAIDDIAVGIPVNPTIWESIGATVVDILGPTGPEDN